MEIRVEHTASSEAFDHAQLLNLKQHKGCPDVIEELNSYKQNPEWDLVLITLSRESDAVMSNEYCLNIAARL